MDNLDGLIGEFGQSLGIADLAFHDDECRIEINTVVIDVIADRRRGFLVLSSYVGRLPDGDRATALARLLHANCSPDMAGAALGVPSDGDAVLVTEQVPAEELDARGLADRIALFLSAAGHARLLLQERVPEAPKAARAAQDTFDTANMLRV